MLKFGGTSVSKRTRWDTIGRLAQQRRDAGARVLVVVSAVSGVTNALQAMIDAHADADAVAASAAALVGKNRDSRDWAPSRPGIAESRALRRWP